MTIRGCPFRSSNPDFERIVFRCFWALDFPLSFLLRYSDLPSPPLPFQLPETNRTLYLLFSLPISLFVCEALPFAAAAQRKLSVKGSKIHLLVLFSQAFRSDDCLE